MTPEKIQELKIRYQAGEENAKVEIVSHRVYDLLSTLTDNDLIDIHLGKGVPDTESIKTEKFRDQAFMTLYSRYKTKILRDAAIKATYYQNSSPSLAEDLASYVWMKLNKKLEEGKFDSTERPFTPWFLALIENALKDAIALAENRLESDEAAIQKHENDEVENETVDPEAGGGRRIVADQKDDLVNNNDNDHGPDNIANPIWMYQKLFNEEINSLSEKDRLIWDSHIKHNRFESAKEIAKRLDISESQYNTKKNRILAISHTRSLLRMGPEYIPKTLDFSRLAHKMNNNTEDFEKFISIAEHALNKIMYECGKSSIEYKILLNFANKEKRSDEYLAETTGVPLKLIKEKTTQVTALFKEKTYKETIGS